jgi:metal-sulfur cluster biosynthetic enzyme
MTAPPSPADVRAALNEIVDPCSAAMGAPAGIDDMGLIRDVDVADGGHVTVRIGLTEPTCLMGPAFVRSAEERLSALEGVADVDVALTSGLDWTPARMSASYAARLERLRATRRGTGAGPGTSSAPTRRRRTG